jgi:hypothetical protein
MSDEQTITQKRVVVVVDRMLESVRKDQQEAIHFSEMLEEMLADIRRNDGFGTEGQCDPRGDFRNGDWHMERVEGIDTKVKQAETGTTQRRVLMVLNRIRTYSSCAEEDAEMFSEALEEALGGMLANDMFGAEGQFDPRGDQRDGSFSMTHVFSVD